MAKFVGLTGLAGQLYFFNIDRISLESVVSYMKPGHYAPDVPDGKRYSWTIVREEGQPDRLVKDRVEDILKAVQHT